MKYIKFWRADHELITKIKKADLQKIGNVLSSEKILSEDDLREFRKYKGPSTN
jgi:hypothetical protein